MGSRTLPMLSVIIAVYNNQSTIENCIKSILNQSYPKERYEVIVVNNNSTDGTASIIKCYPVAYLEEKIQSSYAARNTGARFANGEFFVFFDGDQSADENWLMSLIEGMEDRTYGASVGKYRPVKPSKTALSYYWYCHEKSQLITPGGIDHSYKIGGGNTAIRSDVFKMLGGWDVNMVAHGDYDMGYRIIQAGYKIRSNLAWVIHHERLTVKKQFKRDFRIGYGEGEFIKKYKDFRRSFLVDLYRVLIRTILGIGALILGVFKPLNGVPRGRHLFLIWFDVLMRWFHLAGVGAYRLGIPKDVIAKW